MRLRNANMDRSLEGDMGKMRQQMEESSKSLTSSLYENASLRTKVCCCRQDRSME